MAPDKERAGGRSLRHPYKKMTSKAEEFRDVSARPGVRGLLHRPEKATGEGLVLTHGAGGNCNAPLLVALAERLANAGVAVLRCDLPFRQQRPYGPPHGNGAEDREGLRRAAEALRKIVSGRLYLGGQSYGGRQATMLVAEDNGVADGLLILSYPLHPPGKPEQLRTAHLGKLQAPGLFVQGTKDPFASPEEIKAALKLIPAKTSLLLLENAGHDLGFGRRATARRREIPERIAEAFREVI
jgi:predicted alpha/beta-hydrolase family hydrolase